MTLYGHVVLAAAGLLPAAAAIASRPPQGESLAPAVRTLRDLGATVGLQQLTRAVQDEGFTWGFRAARADAHGAWVWTAGRRSFACAEARWWMRDEIVEQSVGGTRGEDRVEVFDLTTFEHASWSRAAGDARGDVLVQFVRQPDRLWWTLLGFVDPRLGGAAAHDLREVAGGRTDLRFTNLGGVEAGLAFGSGEQLGWFELVIEHERGSFHVLTGPPISVRPGSRGVPAWVLERETRDGVPVSVIFHALLGPTHAEEHVVPAGAMVLDFRRAGAAVQSQALDRSTPLVEVSWNGSAPGPSRLAPVRTGFAVAAECDVIHDAAGFPTATAASAAGLPGVPGPTLVLTASAWKPSAAGERLLDDIGRCGFGLGVGRFDSPCSEREDGRHVVAIRAPDGAATQTRWAVGPDLPVLWLAGSEARDDSRVSCLRCDATAAPWPTASRGERAPGERVDRPRARVRAAGDLVLRRTPGLNRPVGTVVLASDATSETSPSLVGLESGCSITVRGALPIEIPAQGVEVLFEASATRGFDSEAQGLASLRFDAGPPLRLAVRVLDLDPPCRVAPGSIDLTRGGEIDVSIDVRGGDAVAIRDLTAPGCVRIEATHACARHVSLRVREAPDARRRHVCGPVVGLVERRGEPPYTLVARVDHGPLPRRGTDATPFHLVLEPDAEFLLAEDGSKRTRALYPERAPEIGAWVDALGWRLLARGRVGDDGIVLEPLGPTVVLPAVDASISAELETYRDAWRSGG